MYNFDILLLFYYLCPMPTITRKIEIYIDKENLSDEEYKELLRLISRNEDKLLATMTDAQKDLFSRYQDCVREHQAMAECLLFQNSFRLGARIMIEVMGDSN